MSEALLHALASRLRMSLHLEAGGVRVGTLSVDGVPVAAYVVRTDGDDDDGDAEHGGCVLTPVPSDVWRLAVLMVETAHRLDAQKDETSFAELLGWSRDMVVVDGALRIVPLAARLELGARMRDDSTWLDVARRVDGTLVLDSRFWTGGRPVPLDAARLDGVDREGRIAAVMDALDAMLLWPVLGVSMSLRSAGDDVGSSAHFARDTEEPDPDGDSLHLHGELLGEHRVRGELAVSTFRDSCRTLVTRLLGTPA